MGPSELLRHLAATLDRLGFRYFVTGSMATIFFGEPRFTNDLDVVVDLPPSRIDEFCQAFPPPEFYVSPEAIREAIAHRSQFNIIHPGSGLNIDVLTPPDTPFNRSRFARVQRVSPGTDYEAPFASAEDVIVKKLEYYQQGGSEKHLRDIAGMLKVRGPDIDRDYIEHWATQLNVHDVWTAVNLRADE